MSAIDDVTTAVCRLPIDLKEAHAVSAVDLVGRSGYQGARTAVTVARLRDCLALHPEWVDAWFGYSEDQRCTPCLYVREMPDGTGGYEVGLYDRDGPRWTLRFDDRLTACAEYVRREVGQICGS